MKYALHIFALSIGLLLIMDPNYGYQTIVNTLIFVLITSNAIDIRKYTEAIRSLRARVNILERFIEKTSNQEEMQKFFQEIIEEAKKGT